jgi:hypothetical protein
MTRTDHKSDLYYILFITTIFFLIIGCRSSKDVQHKTEDGQTDMQVVEITGRLFVSGNEPFTELALEQVNGSIVIINRESTRYRELHAYQNRTLTLKGWFLPDTVFSETFLMTGYEVIEGNQE